MKKFDIIFPTRERPDLLFKLLNSLVENTCNLNDIEVLIAIDEDDNSYDLLSILKYSFVKIFHTKRSLNFSRDYYTFLSQQGTGRWIIAANDDAVFETMDWDVKAYEALKDKPGVVYGWIEDGLGEYRAKGHGDYCCFPLQGRQGVEALGFVFPADIPTWGADIWAKNLYDTVDSVVDLGITVMHYNYHNKSREQDEVSKRIMNNQVSFDVRATYLQINTLLAVLKEATCPKT